MTVILDASVANRPERAYTRVAQVSSLGSLADAVLAELIALEWGVSDSELVAVPRAVEMFRFAAQEASAPRRIWSTGRVASELLHFSAGSGSAFAAASRQGDNEFVPWLEKVADALEAVAGGDAVAADRQLVREEFSQIATQTMRVASRLVEMRHRV